MTAVPQLLPPLRRSHQTSGLLSSLRAVQGAGTILPGLLDTAAASQERTCTPKSAADLGEVYRDGDDGHRRSAGALRKASLHTTVSRTNEAGGVEEEWESANDRIEASLRGGVSLTSLDVSSPRITVEFIKR